MTSDCTAIASPPVVAHLLHQDGLGGGPVSVGEWVRGLSPRYTNVVLCSGEGELQETCETVGVTYCHVPLASKRQCLWGWIVLWNRLRQLRPDVLVLHGQWAGIVGSVVGRILRIPMVYVVRWSAFHTDWGALRAMRNYICEHVPCHWSQSVVFLSGSVRYQYLQRRLVDCHRGIIIPNPIEPPQEDRSTVRQRIRSALGWSEEHHHVVAIGRLVDQKRHDWLLEAWRQVVCKCPNAKLWIVGGGELADALAGQVHALGLDESCTLLGPRKDGAEMLAAADITAITSEYETFGRVAAEAMVWGCPVVGFDCDGIRDIVVNNQTGLLLPVGETTAFGKALGSLLADPELREQMGDAAIKVAQRYSPKVVMPQIEKALDHIMSNEVGKRDGRKAPV